MQALGAAGVARHRRSAVARAAAAADSDDGADSEATEDDEDEVPLPLRGDALIDPWSLDRDDPSAAVCAVCGDGNSHDGNPVVFCERCNVPVHQTCYGIDALPEGEWLCWPCLMYGARRCTFCGMLDGACCALQRTL
jgi:PHD-finger